MYETYTFSYCISKNEKLTNLINFQMDLAHKFQNKEKQILNESNNLSICPFAVAFSAMTCHLSQTKTAWREFF